MATGCSNMRGVWKDRNVSTQGRSIKSQYLKDFSGNVGNFRQKLTKRGNGSQNGVWITLVGPCVVRRALRV